MKRTYTVVIAVLMASVFLISFFIGRATALKEDDTKDNSIEESFTGTVAIPKDDNTNAVETTQTPQNVPAAPDKSDTPKKEEENNDISVPERMLFPCGKTVLKDYSQTAVYSETMGDWRAHTGIDYSAPIGTEVVSVCDGTVGRIYKDKLWGYTIEIVHSDRVKSVYKNLDKKYYVKTGDRVKGGQAIGKVGKSADIESLESPHLHFEIWQDGVVINPVTYVF